MHPAVHKIVDVVVEVKTEVVPEDEVNGGRVPVDGKEDIPVGKHPIIHHLKGRRDAAAGEENPEHVV